MGNFGSGPAQIVMTTHHHQHAHVHHGGYGHQQGHHTYDPSNLLSADAFYRDTYQQIIDWLTVKPGTAALDAGSGAGGFTELLAEAVGPGGTVVALDVTPDLLNTARERMDRSPFKDRVFYREGDIHHLPFEDRQFDLVWSSRTIHHLPDQIAGVRELRRMLKPGGRMVLREGGLRPRFLPDDLGIGEPGLEERLDWAFRRWFHSNVRGGEPNVRYPHGWIQLLRDAGLVNVSARTIVLELLSPFTQLQEQFITNLLERWVSSDERRSFISGEDAGTIQKLLDTDDPCYVFKRQDLHYLEGVTVYAGNAS